MIDLGALAGLHEHGHELHGYCARCDRWVLLDMERVVSEGHGERPTPAGRPALPSLRRAVVFTDQTPDADVARQILDTERLLPWTD